jgi:hypothetical protein
MLERRSDETRRCSFFAGMKGAPTLVVASFVLVAACVGPFSELQEQQYPSADAAKAADPSGWIPDILPADSTGIRLVHRVDSSLTWGCFNTRRTDDVRASLSRLHGHKGTGPIGSRPAEIFRDFSWWPASMAEGSTEAWELVEPAACAGCAPSNVRVGIDAARGAVCFSRKP